MAGEVPRLQPNNGSEPREFQFDILRPSDVGYYAPEESVQRMAADDTEAVAAFLAFDNFIASDGLADFMEENDRIERIINRCSVAIPLVGALGTTALAEAHHYSMASVTGILTVATGALGVMFVKNHRDSGFRRPRG